MTSLDDITACEHHLNHSVPPTELSDCQMQINVCHIYSQRIPSLDNEAFGELFQS